MMQLQVLVMVLLKLSWFNRLEIVWVSLYVCHCFLFDLKWENVSSNGILHFVSEESALKTLWVLLVPALSQCSLGGITEAVCC